MIERPPPASIGKILVRGVNWIGDTILTLPALEALRTLFPRAHIALLAKYHLCSLFAHSPVVDELLAYPQARGVALLEQEGRLIADLRKGNYDLALIFPRSLRAAIIPFLAGIPYRIGYATNQRGMLLTHRLKETPQLLRTHQVEYYYQLPRFLGARGASPMPALSMSREDENWAQSFYGAAGIGGYHRLIALNPGSTYGSAKCWPPERYIQLARRLLASPRTKVLIVGGQNNASLVDLIALSLNRRVVTAVGIELIKLAALLKRCEVLITNDTGPMHIASAVGTPVVALFGSTDEVTTAPLGLQNRIINRHMPCSPCLKRHCSSDHRCMDAITVDEVEQAVNEQLACGAIRSAQQITAVSYEASPGTP